MKQGILIVDVPERCIDCQFSRVYADGGLKETYCILKDRSDENGVNERAKWCPILRPVWYSDKDYRIYKTDYLLDNLDREIKQLKKEKLFRDHMRSREDETDEYVGVTE